MVHQKGRSQAVLNMDKMTGLRCLVHLLPSRLEGMRRDLAMQVKHLNPFLPATIYTFKLSSSITLSLGVR